MDKRLVLIGGGHSHAIALKIWGLNPIPGVSLTLISDVEQTPYSGMLPGHVAGFYSYKETHIDLCSLSKFAQANLMIDRSIGLDLANNQVRLENHAPIDFDYLSLDIGSTPNVIKGDSLIAIPGAKEYAIPAKPVPVFLNAWQKLLVEVSNHPEKLLSLVIVGGGAGGVELALNMQSRLKREQGSRIEIHLIHRGNQLLSGHNHWVSQSLTKILLRRGIKLHLKQSVTAVFSDRISCESGLSIKCDRIFWVTQATAPSWIKESGLTTDSQGFILVKDTLQSVSHPQVFAAGDIATMINYQRPKAGVFAVRQGKPLVENWRRIITGKLLEPYIPQRNYLALIDTGDQKAIASWSFFGWRSSLFWYFKDYIDRKFMKRFENLQ
jgi:pyridine nucleotide-disulfide oxidoreductase family protein